MGNEPPVAGGIKTLVNAMEGIQALGRGRNQRAPELHEGWGGVMNQFPRDFGFSQTALQRRV